MTIEKDKHIVTKLTVVAKVNIEKIIAKVVEVVNTLNVKRCNERMSYEVRIKEKDHELYVAMKDADLESTNALGNHIVMKEAKILSECHGKETFQRERMFWAEKIVQDKTKILKQFEREKKTISETQAKGVAKLILADTNQTKANERQYYQKMSK